MPADKAVALLLPHREPDDSAAAAGRRKRIGLYNIHQRIRLNYGEAYGLRVWSEAGKGTRVTLRFPDRGMEERGQTAE